MGSVRIALMGAGVIGREHAALVQGHPETVLAGIADPTPEARAFAEGLGVPVYDSYERMLDATKPDGAIVALPNTLHVPAGLACVERRIPALVEKPIADTIAAAMRLVTASEAAKVPVLVGHHRRHSPDIREARRAIAEGKLGELVAVSGMWFVKKPDDYFAAEWRRRAGGGPLLINLIHDLDCFRYMCGEIESVHAVTSNKRRGFEVEDTAALTIRFENGALGSFVLSDTAPSPYTWDVASGQALYFPTQPEDCYYIAGTKASLAVPSMNLWRHEDDGDWQDPLVRHHLSLDRSSCYVNQLDNFVGVIRGTAEPVVTGRDGMMTVAAALAVNAAAAEGRAVRVSDMFP